MEINIWWGVFIAWWVLSGIGVNWLWSNSIRSDTPAFLALIVWPVLIILPALFNFKKEV